MIKRQRLSTEESYKIEDEIRNWQFESDILDDRIISVQESNRDGIYVIIIYYKGK